MADTGKKPSEILDAAADLITPEGAWSKGHIARTDAGSPCSARSTDAAAWCGYGAIERATLSNLQAGRAFQFVADSLLRPGWGPSTFGEHWNDAPERTQPEVIAALRKAADLAREAGQ